MTDQNIFAGRQCIQDVECPQCHGKNARKSTGFGGPAIYRRLVCNLCGFKGGNSRDYEGEEERVEREIRERFVIGKRRDAVHEFVDSVVGPRRA